MKSKELINHWQQWLSTSDKLLRVLHEQTVAVTLRDVARVEKLQPSLEALMAEMRSIDEQALDTARRLAESLGAEPNIRGLVAVLDKNEAQQVQQIANKVTSSAQNVSDVVKKNKKLFESEMTYINGTLTLIAKASVPRKRGPYKPRVARAAVLVDAAA